MNSEIYSIKCEQNTNSWLANSQFVIHAVIQSIRIGFRCDQHHDHNDGVSVSAHTWSKIQLTVYN